MKNGVGMKRLSPLETLARILREASEQSCRDGEGAPYPDVVEVVGNHLVIASLDPAKEYAAPVLKTYSEEAAMAWSGRAYDHRQFNPDLTFPEALMETEE